MKTCPSCGKGIAENTNYCPFCGAPCADENHQEAPEYTQSTYSQGPVVTEPAGTQNAMGIVGLILGIVAIVFVFIPGVSFLGWICGVVGIILSAVAISQAKKAGQKSGLALAGLILSIISIAIGLIVVMIGCIAGCTIASTVGTALF